MAVNEEPADDLGSTTPWSRQCFHARVLVINGGDHYSVTRVLLDSGASANFISHQLVRTLGLRTTTVTHGEPFVDAGGKTNTHREKVCLVMTIAGVVGFIQAYVGGAAGGHLLIGVPGLSEFGVRMDFSEGPRRGMLVTVAPSGSDSQRAGERYIVESDDNSDPSRIIKLPMGDEVEKAQQYGAGYQDPIVFQKDVLIAQQMAMNARLQVQLEESELQRQTEMSCMQAQLQNIDLQRLVEMGGLEAQLRESALQRIAAEDRAKTAANKLTRMTKSKHFWKDLFYKALDHR